MALTAYFDESGTHGDSPGVVVAGFISIADGWKSYETEFTPELTGRGLEVFHAKSLRSERYKSLHEVHSKIIRRNVLWGTSVTLKSSDYKTYYKVPGLPRQTRLDSQYGFCFRMCLMAALHFSSLLPRDWPLTVVVELGHRNAPDATRIFTEVKDSLMQTPHDRMLLGPLVFDTKETCIPLAAADALANWVFRIDSGAVGRPAYSPDDVPSLRKIECTRETLEDFRFIHTRSIRKGGISPQFPVVPEDQAFSADVLMAAIRAMNRA